MQMCIVLVHDAALLFAGGTNVPFRNAALCMKGLRVLLLDGNWKHDNLGEPSSESNAVHKSTNAIKTLHTARLKCKCTKKKGICETNERVASLRAFATCVMSLLTQLALLLMR